MAKLTLGNSEGAIALYYKEGENKKEEVFGLSLPNVFGTLSEDGTFSRINKNDKNIVFSGLKQISSSAFKCSFIYNDLLEDVSFPDLIEINGSQACYRGFYSATNIKKVTMPQLHKIIGDNACTGMFAYVDSINEINLSNLEEVSGSSACRDMFAGDYFNISTVSLPNLKKIVGERAFESFAFGSWESDIRHIDLSSLQEISGEEVCNSAFSNCYMLEDEVLDLSSLTTISGDSACTYMFSYMSDTTKKVDLSKLSNLSGQECCKSMFDYANVVELDIKSLPNIPPYGFAGICVSCPVESVNLQSLSSVEEYGLQNAFPSASLEHIKDGIPDDSDVNTFYHSIKSLGEYSMTGTFKKNTALKSARFDSLKVVASTSFGDGAYRTPYVFDGCTALTEIHFRADAQTTIEAMTGYSSKWGATNATIYFDL